MTTINTKTIADSIYRLLIEINTQMPKAAYDTICQECSGATDAASKSQLKAILQNAELAYTSKRPLCQDTGQVLVFLKIGQQVQLEGAYINSAINDSVARCYKDNFYRKSVVKNALFDRNNTSDNTPAIIYTEIVDGAEIEVNIMIKGGGAENMSKLFMLAPSATQDEIISLISDSVNESGTNSCPPLFLGVGIGGTADKALLLSKKAFFEADDSAEIVEFAEKMKNYINKNNTSSGLQKTVLNVKILSAATHIASMPVAVTFNCHSMRHGTCVIKNDEEITYCNSSYMPQRVDCTSNTGKQVNAHEFDKLKNLKNGDEILLSGEIYTARDAAHKRLIEMLENGETLPFKLQNKIIFYAGPCPSAPGEIIGPVGPTTSKRMDKFTPQLLKFGVIGAIGKGERSGETMKAFNDNGAKYFTAQGGIASYLAQCVIAAEVVAFEDLGTEAIYKLTVKDMPLRCS